MVNPFRRWFRRSDGGDSWSAVAEWAQTHGHRFARSREGDGFVVEGGPADSTWRLEWGPSKRHYFSGRELRVRGDVGATGDLQMLVMARELMVLLEQQVFEESTDGTETRVDDDLPEEMRWLVLYPKVPKSELGVLRDRFGALSSFPRAALSWLDAALVRSLEASIAWLPDQAPLVLVVHRGRLTLRCPAPEPSLAALQGALDVFDLARVAARRVGAELAQGQFSSERPSAWAPPAALPAIDSGAR